MGHIKALTLASAVLLATAGAGFAADLLPPPPAPEPVYADPEFSGWYIRGDVGVGINTISSWKSSFDDTNFKPGNPENDIRNEQKKIGDSAFLRAGVGYQFNNWFRADVTGEYRTGATYTAVQSYRNTTFGLAPGVAPGPLSGCAGQAAYSYDTSNTLTAYPGAGVANRCYDAYSSSVRSIVGMVNGYVDLGTWYNVTPYVGAGVGIARHSFEGLVDQGNSGGFGVSRSISKTNLAWALMTGVGYSVTPNLKLELGYRYLNMGDIKSNSIQCNDLTPGSCHFERQQFKLTSHDLHIGMRWLIGANAQGNGQAMYWGENGATSGTLVRGAGGYAANGGYANGGQVGDPSRPLVKRY